MDQDPSVVSRESEQPQGSSVDYFRMARESLAEMTRQNEDVWEIVESMNQQPTQHECNDSNCTHNRSEPEASDTAKSFGGGNCDDGNSDSDAW